MEDYPSSEFPPRISEFSVPKIRKTIYCKICGKATKKEKSLCDEHVEGLGYVKSLMEEQNAIDAEIAQVSEKGIASIKPDSILIHTALETLNIEDGLYAKRLADNCGIPSDLINVYLKYMERHHLVDLIGKKVYLSPEAPLDATLMAPIRTLTRSQVAEELNIDPATLRKWVRAGAPHDSIKREKMGGYPVYLFNLDEIKEFRETFVKHSRERTVRKRRRRPEGYQAKKPRRKSFWKPVMEDVLAGMPLKKVASKHKVGTKAIEDYMKSKGIRKKPHRIPVEEVRTAVLELKRLSGLNLKKLEELHGFVPKSLASFINKRVKTVPKEVFVRIEEALEHHKSTEKRYRRNPRRRWRRNAGRAPLGGDRPFNFLPQKKTARHVIHCKVCGAATRGGRPFCTEHLDEQPYVQRVYEKQQLRDEEIELVRRTGITAVDPDGDLVESALTALNYGEGLFPKDLVHESDIPADVIGVYIRYLTESGQAGVVPTKKSFKVYLADSPELEEAGPPVIRNRTTKEACKEFGVTPVTMSAWAKQGAPHDKVKGRNLFDLEEVRAWHIQRREAGKKRFKESREKYRGVMNVKPFTEDFWPDLEEDFYNDVPIRDLIENYDVGQKRLSRYIKVKGLERTRKLRLIPFDEPFWEDLEKDFVDGVPVQTITKKYGVDKPRIYRYLEQKGIERERHLTTRTTYDEDFWEDLKQDYLGGASLPNLKSKYRLGPDVIIRFLEHEGLPSFKERLEKKRGFSDPYWDEVKVDYLSGVAIADILKKYKIGKKRLKKYIDHASIPTRVRGSTSRNPDYRHYDASLEFLELAEEVLELNHHYAKDLAAEEGIVYAMVRETPWLLKKIAETLEEEFDTAEDAAEELDLL